jgi:multiple sugar transport system permease protein
MNIFYSLRRLIKYKIPYLFTLPAVLLVGMVCLYPAYYGLKHSFYKTDYLERVRFIGIDNYLYFFRSGGVQNVINSLIYVFGSLVLAIPFALLVALLLNRPIKFRALFRTLLIIPWVISQLIAALLWGWYINPSFGPVNFLIQTLGFHKIDFLGNIELAMPTLIFINAWRGYPLPMILLLAALQTLPMELYEAARVDGASGWRSFIHITLPLIQNTLLVGIIIASLEYFNMVTLMFVLTGGGPLRETEVLGLRAFNEAFGLWHIGYAAAIGSIIFILNVLFSFAYIKVLKKESVY